jgi:hypothetical protein
MELNSLIILMFLPRSYIYKIKLRTIFDGVICMRCKSKDLRASLDGVKENECLAWKTWHV